MSRIELHIEELVLHGFAPADRERIAEAVRGELAARLAARGALDGLTRLAAGGPIERVDAGAIHAVDPSRPAALGAQVAGAVAGALAAPATPARGKP